MDRRTRITDEILERAWLYRDPPSFREGVTEASKAFSALAESASPAESESFGEERADVCLECQIPFDDFDAEDVSCPWCGARRPDPLQAVVWAELRAMELAWPEALSA